MNTGKAHRGKIKTQWIEGYFDLWVKDLKRAKRLLYDDDYCLEGVLVVSCYIGALASARFPALPDNKAYKKLVRRYSGYANIYDKIDLLFFYEWDTSEYRNTKPYTKLTHYQQIRTILESSFGDKNRIKSEPRKRYISQQAIIRRATQNPFKGLDLDNLRGKLKHFSVCEMLYRYIRCHAVHSNSFPLIRRVPSVNGGYRYEGTHIITRDFLWQTLEKVVANLKSECLTKNRFPWQLPNR